jgi:hypothetical protein
MPGAQIRKAKVELRWQVSSAAFNGLLKPTNAIIHLAHVESGNTKVCQGFNMLGIRRHRPFEYFGRSLTGAHRKLGKACKVERADVIRGSRQIDL